VTVRMYRQGLGDAFLLGFHPADGRPRWVLVDCGVVGRKDAGEIMNQVAQDIAATTRDDENPEGRLHRVIISSTRWDHVSGFFQARAVFEKMSIDEIWLPATVDPGSESAQVRQRQQTRRLEELRRIAQRLPPDGESLAQGLTGLLGLFGDCDQDAAAADAIAAVSEGALACLRERRAAGTRVRYLDQRTAPLILFPDLPVARGYILGPQDRNATQQSPPEEGRLNLADSFLRAAQSSLGMSPAEQAQFKSLLERNLPFPPNEQVTFDVHQEKEGPLRIFKPPVYDAFFEGQYFAEEEKWRRIDFDWMGATRNLILTLDREASNQGLAIALELLESGKVLLFPGDAQIGAWQSWDALTWMLTEDSRERKVTARDLLRRTALYKVSHRCSATGTLLQGGLEQTERDDLVALLPVDRNAAQALRWEMPFAPLLQRLRAKTRGRILISDTQEPRLADRPRPGALTAFEWQAFQQSVREEDLFVEYSLAP
jgi:hypothetical protein